MIRILKPKAEHYTAGARSTFVQRDRLGRAIEVVSVDEIGRRIAEATVTGHVVVVDASTVLPISTVRRLAVAASLRVVVGERVGAVASVALLDDEGRDVVRLLAHGVEK